MRTSPKTTAALLAATLTLSGCSLLPGGDTGPVLETAEQVEDALASSLDGTYRYEARLELYIDPDEVERAGSAFGEDVVLGVAERALIADMSDKVGRFSVTGAKLGARAGSAALAYRGQDLLGLAYDLSDAPSLTEVQAMSDEQLRSAVVPVGLYSQVDLGAVESMVGEFQTALGSLVGPGPDELALEEQARAALQEQLADVPVLAELAEAFIAGETVGIAGDLDLSRIAGDLDDADLAELRDTIDQLSGGQLGTFRDVFDAGVVTVTSVSTDADTGVTTAAFDLDLSAVADQVAEQMGYDADVAMMMEMPQFAPVADAGEYVFDAAGNLTQTRLRLLPLLEQAAASFAGSAGPDEAAMFDAAVAELAETRVDVVIDYRDHGTSDEVGQDAAVVIGWDDLYDVIDELARASEVDDVVAEHNYAVRELHALAAFEVDAAPADAFGDFLRWADEDEFAYTLGTDEAGRTTLTTVRGEISVTSLLGETPGEYIAATAADAQPAGR